MDHTKAILSILEVLRKKEVADKQPFKAKAYMTVAKNIAQLGKPIYTMDDLATVKGIGEKIQQKLIELFETGKVQAAENASNDKHQAIITELMKIHGIGPAKAKTLVEEHGVLGIDSLQEKLETSPQLLNDKQKMGLKYWKDFEQRIPRKEMLVHEELLGRVIKSIDPKFEFQLTGSFRRMEPSSGDIDILITHEDDPSNVEELFRSVLDRLKQEGYLCDVFAEGGKKCLGVCRLKRYKNFRRIDLLYTNKKEYPFAVLYFTGNADFNIAMRSHFVSKGYSLSEHGIKDEKTGEFIDTGAKSERDIFAFVGLNYVEPHERKANAYM